MGILTDLAFFGVGVFVGYLSFAHSGQKVVSLGRRGLEAGAYRLESKAESAFKGTPRVSRGVRATQLGAEYQLGE